MDLSLNLEQFTILTENFFNFNVQVNRYLGHKTSLLTTKGTDTESYDQ